MSSRQLDRGVWTIERYGRVWMKAIILDMYGVIVKQTGDEFVHYLVINAQDLKSGCSVGVTFLDISFYFALCIRHQNMFTIFLTWGNGQKLYFHCFGKQIYSRSVRRRQSGFYLSCKFRIATIRSATVRSAIPVPACIYSVFKKTRNGCVAALSAAWASISYCHGAGAAMSQSLL